MDDINFFGLFRIYVPIKNFSEYFGIMVENSSAVYIMFLCSSFFLYILTRAFTAAKKDQLFTNKILASEDEDITEKETLIRRFKKAQNRALNQKIQEKMTEQELEIEERIQKEQLTKIYDLLKENEDKFGKITMDDLKGQMSLYT